MTIVNYEDEFDLPPVDYDINKVPKSIKDRAEGVRDAIFGKQNKEFLAQSVEISGLLSAEAKSSAAEISVKQNSLEQRFLTLQQETTNGDYDSAPEIIDARGGKATLGQRLAQNDERLVDLEVFNVKDYGAIGDGITNDTQAFKDLTNDINLMEHVKVKIPAGIYIIDEKMMFRVNNSQLIFEGEIKLKDGMETPFGLVGFSGRNNVIIGVSVDGNNANAIDEGRAGVSSLVNFGNCRNVVFKNFKLKNSMYTALTCAGGNYDITFDGFEFNNIGEHCMYLSGGNNHKFYFNDIVVNGFGMYNERGQSLVEGHACFVIKSRNDTNGASSKWVAKNFNVNRLSDLFHGNAILGITDVLKDFDIKNVEADCYIVNSLNIPENFKMTVDNAKCHRITFGDMRNKCVIEVNNCETQTLEGHLFNFKSVSNSTFNSIDTSSTLMRNQIQDFTTEISNCVFNFVENARFNVGGIRNNVYFQNCVFNKDEAGTINLIFNFTENPTKQTFIFFEKSVFNIQNYLFIANQELLNVIVDLCYKPNLSHFSGTSINYIVNNHIPTLLSEQQQV